MPGTDPHSPAKEAALTRTCLIADDHPALAIAVADFLSESGYTTLGPAPDGRRAVELAAEHEPAVAVVDWRMPHLEGPELVRALRAASPETGVVVYTAEADEHVARAALEAGSAGVVLKEAPLADLARALQSVEHGRSYVDPGVLQAQTAAELTQRELAVLAMIADGLSHEQIGDRLGIGAETVRTHMKKACTRLGASTRTQAVAAALRQGLIA
jgi:DNA-binding NarL/FixJ family response regulator